MSTPAPRSTGQLAQTGLGSRGSAQLADVLERVLDKGIVIAGDIQVNLLDIELLTIRIRLLVASADKAREMGIDWWEGDPFLSRGRSSELEDRVKALEAATGIEHDDDDGTEPARRGEDEGSA